MNKKISLIIIICMILSITMFVSANSEKENISSIYGYKIPSELVDGAFSQSDISSKDILDSEIILEEISINKNEVSIKAKIDEKNVLLTGLLYLSSKNTKDSKDIVVGKLYDDENGLESVFFQIKNNTQYYNVIFDNELDYSKSLILYLKNKNGDVYAYEESLDNINIEFSKIECNNFAEVNIDLGWFYNVVKFKRQEIPFDSSIFPNIGQNKSSHYYIGAPSSIIYYSGYIGTEFYQQYGYPYFEGYINDIITNSHEHWTNTLKLEQTTKIDGVEHDYHNAHFFRLVGSSDNNDKIYSTIASGLNTRFQTKHLGYSFLKNSQTNYYGLITGAVGLLADSLPGVSAAYDYIVNFSDFMSDVVFNIPATYSNDSTENLGQNKRAVLYTVNDSSLNLCCAHNKIDLSYDVYVMDNSQPRDQSTYAVINWKFDIEFNGSFDSKHDILKSVTYIVND